MGYGRLLLAPFGDQLRGKGMAKIMKPWPPACSVGDKISGESAECIVNGLLIQWMAGASDKKAVGAKGMASPGGSIPSESAHGGRLERQHPFRAELCARHMQSTGLGIEIGFFQAQGLPHAQPGTGDEANEGDKRDRAQRITWKAWQRRRSTENQTNLGCRVDMGRPPSMGGTDHVCPRHLDPWVEDGAETRKSPQRLQPLCVVKLRVFSSRQGRPSQGERCRERLASGDAVGEARELQHLHPFDPQCEAEFAALSQITAA